MGRQPQGLGPIDMIDDGKTIFDSMLMHEIIGLAEHEAAHRFMDDLSRSGTSIPSVDLENLDSGSPRSFREKGDSIADQRMIFSDAYRSMDQAAPEDSIRSVMTLCNSPFNHSENRKILEEIGSIALPALSALSKHYGCSKRDPRRILRSQMYMR